MSRHWQWRNTVDDRALYDILVMFLVLFLCIGWQIRWKLEELPIVWGTYCIVFTRVVVIQFYLRSCNLIWVLWLYIKILYFDITFFFNFTLLLNYIFIMFFYHVSVYFDVSYYNYKNWVCAHFAYNQLMKKTKVIIIVLYMCLICCRWSCPSILKETPN